MRFAEHYIQWYSKFAFLFIPIEKIVNLHYVISGDKRQKAQIVAAHFALPKFAILFVIRVVVFVAYSLGRSMKSFNRRNKLKGER